MLATQTERAVNTTLAQEKNMPLENLLQRLDLTVQLHSKTLDGWRAVIPELLEGRSTGSWRPVNAYGDTFKEALLALAEQISGKTLEVDKSAGMNRQKYQMPERVFI